MMETERKNLHGVHTFYIASYWWRDSGPSISVIGLDADTVEQEIDRLMREEAQEAFYAAEPEDERTSDDYADEIVWSGIHQFSRAELIRDVLPSHGFPRREAVHGLVQYGLAYVGD